MTKEWILKECRSFDDGDLLQSASSKVLLFEYTCFGLCVMCMAPLLMLIDSFKRKKEILKRESIKYIWQKREDWKYPV